MIPTPVKHISQILIESKESVAVAESVTGGYLQYLLSTCPNAQQFYAGGITAYNQHQKIALLGINPTIAFENNAVSLAVAQEMARGTMQLFKCDWSIGITGFSTPPENNMEEKPYCYFSIWYKNLEVLSNKLYSNEGNKSSIQEFFAFEVFKQFSTTLKSTQI